MTISRVHLVCGFLCCSLASVAIAQQPSSLPSPETKATTPHGTNDDSTPEGLAVHEQKKYDSFVKNLNLKTDQQPKVKAVLDSRLAEEQDALKLSPEARKSRMKEINAESQGKMRALLDEDQLAKYNMSLQGEANKKAARQQKSHPVPPQSPQDTKQN